MRALFLQFAMVGSLMLIAFETGQWLENRKDACIEIAQVEDRHAGQ